jgi:hypothetical protein
MTRQRRLALWMVVVAAGAMLVGWDQGSKLGESPAAALTLTRAGSTMTITHTRRVKRVVVGRVVRLASGTRVVYVPRVVVHVRSCHRTPTNHCARLVVVPAHRRPLEDATVHQLVATATEMPVTVYVTLPPVTVVEPVTVTETQPPDTVTVTSTLVVTCIPPQCLPEGTS